MRQSDEKTFIGVLGVTDDSFEGSRVMLRAAFKNYNGKESFNICTIHSHPKYSYKTFAEWVRAYHCKDLTEAEGVRIRIYLTNYFLCPEATDLLEVTALVYEIWPELLEQEKVEVKAKKPWYKFWGSGK